MVNDTRVLSNQRVSVFIGPASGIANWTNGPTIAEGAALLNVSGAVNWDAFDLNLAKSDASDRRTLTDAAGAKARSFNNFGGSIEFVTPKPSDTSSIYRQTYNILKGDRVDLAVVIRTVTLNSAALAAGDVVNVYHAMSDSQALKRTDTDYGYAIKFLPQDDVGVNCIVPSSTPTKVTLTPTPTGTATVGTPVFLKAIYEGNNITVGATYAVDDATKGTVTPHGILIPAAVGSISVTATYPGSAAGTPTVFTIS